MHCPMPFDTYNQTTRRGFTALSPRPSEIDHDTQCRANFHSRKKFEISKLPEKVPPSESRTEDPSIAHEMWTELKLNAKRVH